MNKILFTAAIFTVLSACNNSKNDQPATTTTTPGNTNPVTTNNHIPPNGAMVSFTVDDKENTLHGSALVSKDKDKLSADNDYRALMTASNRDTSSKESLILSFVFSLKPGTYPVVGYSYSRHVDGKAQIFGGLLGGTPKISNYKVNLTSCENISGHHWKMSGSVDEITIPANGFMQMDKKNDQPKEITLKKISFSDLLFEDNWDELMNDAMKKLNMKKN